MHTHTITLIQQQAPPSTVDWCEDNYAYTIYIAEFWNTLTSFVLLYAGMIGYIRHKPLKGSFVFVILALVGLGSICFHGSLSATTQMLDEIPMVFLSSQIAVNVLSFNKKQTFVAHCIASLFSYIIYKIAFINSGEIQAPVLKYGVSNGTQGYEFYIFQMTIILFAASLFYKILTKSLGNSKLMEITIDGAILFTTGWLCWLIDYFACDFLQKTFNPQFHAWWHVLSALGVYRFCLLSLMHCNNGVIFRRKGVFGSLENSCKKI
jgi:dihydroceramidase